MNKTDKKDKIENEGAKRKGKRLCVLGGAVHTVCRHEQDAVKARYEGANP